MRRQFLSIITFFVIAFSLNAQGNAKLIEKQLKDFNVFKTTLFELEARPFRHISKDSLNYFLDQFEKELKLNILSHTDLFRNYAQIISKIQSGHTSIQPSKYVLEEWVKEKNSLPMDVLLIGKKLYIQEDYPLLPPDQMAKLSSSKRKKKVIPLYTEIVKINNKTISEWMELISPFVSSDEDFIDFKYFIIKDAFELYRYLASPAREDSISIDYVKKYDTVNFKVKSSYPPIEAISYRFEQIEENAKRNEKDFGEFKFLNKDFAYFKFNSFVSCSGKKYNAFLKNAFFKIHKAETPNLVIDVRGNLGGVIQLDFLRYVKFKSDKEHLGGYNVEKREKPTFKRYIRKNKAYKRNRKLLKSIKRMEKKGFNGAVTKDDIDQEPILFDGKIIVITDEGSFSASSLLASHLKDLCHAKIVGVPAGGSFYEGVSGTNSLRLPTSKIMIDFNPNYYFSSLDSAVIDQSVKNPDLEFIELYGEPKKVGKKNKKNFLKALKATSKMD